MCMPRFDWVCLLVTQREASEDYLLVREVEQLLQGFGGSDYIDLVSQYLKQLPLALVQEGSRWTVLGSKQFSITFLLMVFILQKISLPTLPNLTS